MQQTSPGSIQPAPAVPAYLQPFYEVLGKIGEGTYGVVFLARVRGEKEPRMLAIKTFKPGKEGEGVSPTAVREIMLLKALCHEHVVRLDSVRLCRTDPSLSLAFDYAEHDLYELVRHHREKARSRNMEPYAVKSLLWQLLKGLAYLHRHAVMHRDLKPSNVLVMGDGPEHGRVKIADFGLARTWRAPLRPLSDNGVVVTIWYRAPELLLGAQHYTAAVDVWAAGCIFAELLTLRPLFPGNEVKAPSNAFQADQLDKIFTVLGHPSNSLWAGFESLHYWRDNTDNIRTRRSHHPPAPTLDSFITQQMYPGARVASSAMQLLARMLDYDPTTRVTAEEALNDAFFLEEPLPGPDAFVSNGRAVAEYPSRLKYKAASTPVPIHPPEGGLDPSAPSAQQLQQNPAAAMQLPTQSTRPLGKEKQASGRSALPSRSQVAPPRVGRSSGHAPQHVGSAQERPSSGPKGTAPGRGQQLSHPGLLQGKKSGGRGDQANSRKRKENTSFGFL
ncbi:hypothetical protein WJX84_012189 [Apatococcus fuscideae]|uniref:Protein kinase domain-containing protein n=1 Tax=Apatococcus fuscideae TaxID=2026836 RepID=A0AAW1SSJ6_9CHLO